MKLDTDRMYYAGEMKPKNNEGFGSLYQDGFYINYLHGLDFLCRKHIKSENKILELGSFNGVSSELFFNYSKNLTCVDINLYPEMENLLKILNINFIKMDSIEFLKTIPHNYYDLIYIDTTHDFGRTKEEIILSYDALSEGGVIAGHDYNSHGVHNAIMDVFEYPDIEIYLDSSWAITKNINLKIK